MANKTRKIIFSSILGVGVCATAIATPLAICLPKANHLINKTTTTSNFLPNKSIISSTQNAPIAISGNMLLAKDADYNFAASNTTPSNKPASNPIIWSDQLADGYSPVINSNISSTSSAPISYAYYATNIKPQNMSHPIGGKLVATTSSNKYQISSLLASTYTYWWVKATQTTNGTIYTLTTNVITLNVQQGPISNVTLSSSSSSSPISSELVNGFPTLSVTQQLQSDVTGSISYTWYGTNSKTLFLTNNEIAQTSTNSYTLNQNDLEAGFTHYFVQAKLTTSNGQIFVANSNMLSLNYSQTDTPISAQNGLLINDNGKSSVSVSVSTDQTNNLPTLSIDATSTISTTTNALKYTWYATNANNNLAGRVIATNTTTGSLSLTQNMLLYLAQENDAYIYVEVSQSDGTQSYLYTSNPVNINITTSANPLSQSPAPVVNNNSGSQSSSSSSSSSSQPTSTSSSNSQAAPQTTTPTNATPSKPVVPPAPTVTNVVLNPTINSSSLMSSTNTGSPQLISYINNFYSSNGSDALIAHMFASGFNTKDMEVSGLVYNWSELTGFSFKNDSSQPINLSIYGSPTVINHIAPNATVNIELMGSQIIKIITTSSSFSNTTYTYNLSDFLTTNAGLKNYYAKAKYDSYAYLYPMLWTQDNYNCLTYNANTTYSWNQGFGPTHTFTITDTNWTTEISTYDNPTFKLSWIGQILGINNTNLQYFQGYKIYVPQNDSNNNTVVISEIEYNGSWYSTNYILNGGSNFYLS